MKEYNKYRQNKIVRILTRDDINSVNRSIEPKIRQNKQERIESFRAASKCIVGSNDLQK